eukprot:TRINITY_DN3887_c0_g1_i2.p2 TRINITY_DN3887_c0_g1~~TRINITY_DN3887_c0_g1_i2.p2  ORF type:complete len:185 (-),score=38.05 TRINITY_DN3887_c0_g1_i2:212-766(-)
MATQQVIEEAYEEAHNARMKVKDPPLDAQQKALKPYQMWQQRYVEFEKKVQEASSQAWQLDAKAWEKVRDAYNLMETVGFDSVPTTSWEPPPDPKYQAIIRHMRTCWRRFKNKPNGGNGFYHGSQSVGAPPDDYEKVSASMIEMMQPQQCGLPQDFWLEHSHTTERLAIHRKVDGAEKTFIYHL